MPFILTQTKLQVHEVAFQLMAVGGNAIQHYQSRVHKRELPWSAKFLIIGDQDPVQAYGGA
jgi:hypothetical protein